MAKIIKFPGVGGSDDEGNEPEKPVLRKAADDLTMSQKMEAYTLRRHFKFSRDDSEMAVRAQKKIIGIISQGVRRTGQASHQTVANMRQLADKLNFLEIAQIFIDASSHLYAQRPTYYAELYKKFSRIWNDIMDTDNRREENIMRLREKARLRAKESIDQ